MAINKGRVLGDLLKEKGLTVSELDRLSGVDKSTISRIIRYNVGFTVELAERLAAGLEVPVSKLLGEEGNTEDPFIAQINKLPAKKKALLKVFVKALESAQVDFNRADEGPQPMFFMLRAAGY